MTTAGPTGSRQPWRLHRARAQARTWKSPPNDSKEEAFPVERRAAVTSSPTGSNNNPRRHRRNSSVARSGPDTDEKRACMAVDFVAVRSRRPADDGILQFSL